KASRLTWPDRGNGSRGPGRFQYRLRFRHQLVAQRKTVRHLLRIRLIQRLAELTAINLCFFSDSGLYRLWIVVPTLQMSGAQLALGVLFVARPLFRFSHLQFNFLWRSLCRRCRGCRWCGVLRRRWCSRWGALRCGLLSHSLFLFPSELRSEVQTIQELS